jgi:hypothetical protein
MCLLFLKTYYKYGSHGTGTCKKDSFRLLFLVPLNIWGGDTSVGIATGYGLDGPGIESRWVARFFAHVQTGLGAHPASCTMGTGCFQEVKRPGRGADHPPLLAPRSRKSTAIPLPALGLQICYRIPLPMNVFWHYAALQIKITWTQFVGFTASKLLK